MKFFKIRKGTDNQIDKQKEIIMHKEIKRKDFGERSPSIPQPVPQQDGMVIVDSTWGEIQSIQAAEGVQTVGELEVIKHIENGLPVIDGRTENFFQEATLPGAKNIPFTEAGERISELNRDQMTILFCNGPQCPQSPWAIRALLESGYPAEKLMYYRGGMHDWLTLGLPVRVPSSVEKEG